MQPIVVIGDDLLYCFRAVSFIWNQHVRQLMVYFPAHFAAQPPYVKRLHHFVAVDDLALSAAIGSKTPPAHWAYDIFFASYVKFPISSSSFQYRFMDTIHTHSLMVAIISGYSWTGKPVGCRASCGGGNTLAPGYNHASDSIPFAFLLPFHRSD